MGSYSIQARDGRSLGRLVSDLLAPAPPPVVGLGVGRPDRDL